MFDLDGTLTETAQADEECFVKALADVFDFDNIDRDWSAYRHVTDSGILFELFESRLNRVPRSAEVERFQSRFVALLDETLQNSRWFEPVPGIELLLQELADRNNFGIALATGGWKVSAQWKLQQAGLRFMFGASAFADDDFSREGIMRCGFQRALDQYGRVQFDAIFYVGDAIWDVQASKNLGYHFVGIGSGIKAKRLYSAGATTVFPDYLNASAFVNVLESIGRQSEPCRQKL